MISRKYHPKIAPERTLRNSTKWKYQLKHRYKDGSSRHVTSRPIHPDAQPTGLSGIYRISKAEEDPYEGLPAELRPIHPGGGSKFDDWEREKLERNKMAQKKETGESQSKHDAEGYRSSSVCQKLQIGLYLYIIQFILLFFY